MHPYRRPDELRCPLRAGVCDKARDLPHPHARIRTSKVFISYDTAMVGQSNLLTLMEESVQEEDLEPVSFEIGQGLQFWCGNICPEVRRCALLVAEVSLWDPEPSQSFFPCPRQAKLDARANPNVMMELGMAHALHKRIILVATERCPLLPEMLLKDERTRLVRVHPLPDPTSFRQTLRDAIRDAKEAERQMESRDNT